MSRPGCERCDKDEHSTKECFIVTDVDAGNDGIKESKVDVQERDVKNHIDGYFFDGKGHIFFKKEDGLTLLAVLRLQ